MRRPGDAAVVKKLRRSSLSGDAYAFVRDLFTNGSRYNPGEKISVEELSRELGVSRTPLWGAINRLEAEGIVEIVPRQGVYLINYDPDRALEVYEAREALEGMAARLAADLGLFDAYIERIRAWRSGGRPQTGPDPRFRLTAVADRWRAVLAP